MNTMNPYRRRQRRKFDLNLIGTVLTIVRILLIVLTLVSLALTMILSLNVGKESGNGLFGRKFFIVADSMMEPSYKAGTLVTAEAAAAYYPGDVIVFKSSAPESYGSVTVRAIRSEIVHNGRTAFITYPASTGSDDISPAYNGDVLGRVTASHPLIGSFYSFMRSSGGYMLLILLPFMLLILCEIARYLLTAPVHKPQPAVQSSNIRYAYDPRTGSTASQSSQTPQNRARVINGTSTRTSQAVNPVPGDTARHTRQAMSDTAQHTRQTMSDTARNISVPKKQAAASNADVSQETAVWNKIDIDKK